MPAGSPTLLDRLIQLVLVGTPTPAAAIRRQASLALGAFAATPDGCAAVLRTTLLARAQKVIQDGMAARECRSLEDVMACLANLASQPEAQRALVRAGTGPPLVALLELLLGLMQQEQAPTLAAEAALVLRNVALHPESKAHFLAQQGALQQLVGAVAAAGQQPLRAAHAAGALLALLVQGERVKAALRRSCPNLEDALEAALAMADQSAEGPQLCTTCTALKQLLA